MSLAVALLQAHVDFIAETGRPTVEISAEALNRVLEEVKELSDRQEYAHKTAWNAAIGAAEKAIMSASVFPRDRTPGTGTLDGQTLHLLEACRKAVAALRRR